MQQVKNREFLKKQWNLIYNSKDSKLIMVGNVQGLMTKKQGFHFIILNKTLTQKRENNLLGSKQKKVFLPFSSQKFNLCNVSNKEVLFHINLDEEVIISKDETHKITQIFFDKEEGGQDDQIQSHTHPVLINTAPVCRFQSFLSMYPDEELPQVVGSDILLLLMNIFKILPTIKVGYNSIGAATSVNHLHFHLVYAQDLINCKKLPIETVEQKQWLKSSLTNPSQQINLYSVGICINEIIIPGTYAMVLQPYRKDKQNLEHAEVTNSLSFVFGIIANQLIESNIPHNLLITDDGQTIYIFIRDFCNSQNVYGWMEFSGVIVTSDEKDFAMKQPSILQKKKSISLEQSSIDLLKSNIKKHLSKFS